MQFFFNKSPLTAGECGLVLLTGLYVLAGWLLASRYDLTDHFRPFFYIGTGYVLTKFLLLLLIIGWGLSVFRIMIVNKPKNLKEYLWDRLKYGPLNRERYIRALPVFICFLVFFSTFTSMKFMIPALNPFSWDSYFADLDSALHGGVDPWRLLQPALGYPYVTLLVNGIYNLWLLILYLVLYWQMFSLKSPALRMKFFYVFILSWIINGTILAVYFSSAGPCFYDLVTGSDRYGPLMEYLRSVTSPETPIWSVKTQMKLWDSYTGNSMGIGAGISAMPSVHVATAFLFMLLGLKSEEKLWRRLSVLYFLFILIGSVHLAWHYAVDGYLAVLTTAALWFGISLITARCRSHS